MSNTKPLPVVVENEKLRAKILWARNDLSKHMLYLEGITPYPIQIAINERLQYGARELLSVFREFGKSTLGEILATNELAFKNDVFVYYFSYTYDAVIPRLNTIVDFFERDKLPTGEDNPFTQLLPTKKGNKSYKWGKGHYKLINGNLLKGAGADTFVLGAKEKKIRPSLIIIDDPVHPDAQNTDKKIIQQWFRQTISNLGNPMTRIIVIGTTRRHSDLIMLLLKKTSIYNTNYIPALGPLGKPTVPEYWIRPCAGCNDKINPAFNCFGLTGDALIKQHIIQKKREVGSIAWSSEFMLQPVDDGTSLFPMPTLKMCRNKGVTFQFYRDLFEEFRMREQAYGINVNRPITVIGCDHAVSESEEADYSVFTVLMCSPNEPFIMVDRYKNRGDSYTEQKNKLKLLSALYRPSLVYSEKNGYQRVFSADIREFEQHIPIKEFFTQYNKAAIEVGIPSLKSYFENKSYVLPYGDEESQSHVDELLIQFNGIGLLNGTIKSSTAHDDDVLSFWIATSAAVEVRSMGYSTASFSLKNKSEEINNNVVNGVLTITNFDNNKERRDYYF